jgi:hypothetical protein
VRELADVDLRSEVAADRVLQRLARLELAAREGPAPRVRLERPLPEEHRQPGVAHLQHDGEGGLRRPGTRSGGFHLEGEN